MKYIITILMFLGSFAFAGNEHGGVNTQSQCEINCPTLSGNEGGGAA